MIIDAGNITTDLFQNINVSAIADNTANGLFAGHLEEQVAILGSFAAGSEKQAGDEDSDDMAAIKEKGLVAYIMELHEKKIREEILASMGLTEEDLAKMPPEQRAAIEKLIAEETQKRLAAESLLQDDEDKKTGNSQKNDKSQLAEMMFGMNSMSPLKIAEMKEMENTGKIYPDQE